MTNELTVVKVARLKYLERNYEDYLKSESAEFRYNRRLGVITLASGLRIRICVGEHSWVESKNKTPECTPRYPVNGFDWMDLVVEGTREPQILKDWRAVVEMPREWVDLWNGQQWLYEGLDAYMLQNLIASEGGIIEGSVRSDINMPKLLQAPDEQNESENLMPWLTPVWLQGNRPYEP
jgi:hypothetical protein